MTIDLWDQIMDPDNADPIVVFTEEGEELRLEQVAVIPLGNEVFLLAQPLNVPEIADDEALVYLVDRTAEGTSLVIVEDDMIVDTVFEEYYRMLREAGIID